MNASNPGPKIAIGCGTILLFLAFCVTVFGAYHVFIDGDGAISASEAMPALLGGGLCMFIDFVIVAVGIALVLRGGQQPQGMQQQGMQQQGMQAPSGTPFPQGGTQMMSGSSLPGAPPASAGQPWHLLTGCGSLFFVVTLCLSLGGIGYFYSEVQRWQEHLASDQYPSYDPYGSGGSEVDDLIVMIDQGAIEENQQYTGLSSCCCLFSFLFACAFAGATIRLVQKRRQSGA